MYSLHELLRFRLPAAKGEAPPHLYSTMSVKDLEAQSPKSPGQSPKKEKRGDRLVDRTKARAGAKVAKQKAGSWR
jgi:hypothetical protein